MIHSLVASLSLVPIFGIENQSSVFYVIIVIYPYTFIDKTLYSKGKKSVVKIEVPATVHHDIIDQDWTIVFVTKNY